MEQGFSTVGNWSQPEFIRFANMERILWPGQQREAATRTWTPCCGWAM
ncbi:hypothetical protein [Acutalibacter sp. 1XD8-33]|nr:hypothetical protein [Acutalibacter sp. 1XD8-33]